MNIATSVVLAALLYPGFSIAQTLPDFVVTSLQRGNSLPVTIATVCNVGTASNPQLVNLTLSSNLGGPATYLLYSWWGPGQCETLNLGYCSDVGDPGCLTPQITLIAEINPDASVAESDYWNNTRLTNFPKPDLVAMSVTATLDVAARTFHLRGDVCNFGAGWGWVVATLAVGEMVGWDGTGPLAPGACASVEATVNASLPGWYSPTLIVDPENEIDEANEYNNQAVGGAVAWGPDLVPLYAGAFSVGYGWYRAWAIACNYGVSDSPGLPIDFRASLDNTINGFDPYLGGAYASGLIQPNTCVAVFSNDFHFPFSGTWVIGAIADSSNAIDELSNWNNVLAGSSVTVP